MVTTTQGSLQNQCSLLAGHLENAVANLRAIANDPDPEGCTALENALDAETAVANFTNWYYTD